MNITVEKSGPVDTVVTAPPSKSYTHRALICGALGSGTTTIRYPLYSEDTELTIRALSDLGIDISADPFRVTISGCNGVLPNSSEKTLDLNNSGTSLRLLTSIALLSRYPVVLTGSRRMQERPISPLAEALPAIGGNVEFLKSNGFPPLRVSGHLSGGRIAIDGSISSQFISSVLLAAPYADHDVDIILPSPPASASYLDITVDVMQKFGAQVTREGYTKFQVSTKSRYAGREYLVEGDYSSASYFFAAAAVCGGKVTVKNLEPESVQGDRRFLEALEMMGCHVTKGPDWVSVERTESLKGLVFDMATSPDTAQTLCIAAALATSPTTITGVGHLKYKESDRVTAMADRLQALGADVIVENDSITIRPGKLHGGTIDPENDHRTAMSFAILGLAVGGITITNAECVEKSFPEFWDVFRGMIP